MDKILLIDAHNQMWRACVKFGPPKPKDPPSEADNKAEPDEVIFTYNFFRNLRPLIETFSPDKCFFVLEGHPQFRYDLFADYKANRIHKQASKSETSDTFFRTKDIIVPLMNHLPITTCRAANYEADDVIATLCDNMKSEDLTILSNDSDYIQMLQRGYPKIQIYNPIKKAFMEAPDYPYVPWKCLNGDKSDNIPALLKPAKALKTVNDPVLFQQFMDVQENRSNFNLNRDLIEFRTVPLEEIAMREGVKDFDKLKEQFGNMKFETMINDKSWEKYCKTFDCIKY